MTQLVIKKDRVQIEGRAEPRSLATREGSVGRHAKSAVLVEHEGVVRAIEVTCACGEKTLIELAYATLAKEAA